MFKFAAAFNKILPDCVVMPFVSELPSKTVISPACVVSTIAPARLDKLLCFKSVISAIKPVAATRFTTIAGISVTVIPFASLINKPPFVITAVKLSTLISSALVPVPALMALMRKFVATMSKTLSLLLPKMLFALKLTLPVTAFTPLNVILSTAFKRILPPAV